MGGDPFGVKISLVGLGVFPLVANQMCLKFGRVNISILHIYQAISV
jgi:hypothetical protein